jgi:hypothetical protein
MKQSGKNFFIAALAVLAVLSLLAWGFRESYQQEEGARRGGSSTEAVNPGSIQDHQPAERPSSTPPLIDTNVPPAGNQERR